MCGGACAYVTACAHLCLKKVHKCAKRKVHVQACARVCKCVCVYAITDDKSHISLEKQLEKINRACVICVCVLARVRMRVHVRVCACPVAPAAAAARP